MHATSYFFYNFSLQQVVDSRHDIIEENEELKVTVTKLQERKTELSVKVTYLEKERNNLENECCDVKTKVFNQRVLCPYHTVFVSYCMKDI